MEKNEKFLSLEWFKERVGTSIDRAVENRLDKLIEGEEIPPLKSNESLWLNLKLVNDVLIVVLRDGRIFTKPNATEKDFDLLKFCISEEEILDIIQDRQVAKEDAENKKEAGKLTALAKGIGMLKDLKDFKADGKSLYLKGTSRTIPELLIYKFAEVVGNHRDAETIEALEEELSFDDEYQGLKNFFMWCCLNPRAEVADSLYDFLDKNGMKITRQGFFVALRNVVDVDSNTSPIVQFISNAYNKVKAVWKKNPSEYNVVLNKDNSYSIVKIKPGTTDNVIGNLTLMYLDLPNMIENRFTDNWTKTFDIRIGQVVSMPKEEANWSTQDCATAGLHFAGHTAPYVLCGDTTVFTLHNPMKVVGIGKEKGRCWEYLPFMTTNIKEADQIMNSNDFDFLQLDEAYAIDELENLLERAKEGFTIETSKYSFNLPNISTDEINTIVKNLEEMRNKIIKRVSLID